MSLIKNSVKIFILFLFCATSCFANVQEDKSIFVNDSIKKHLSNLSNSEILEINLTEEGIYQVFLNANGNIVPVYTNGEWVIVGTKFVEGESNDLLKINSIKKDVILQSKSELEELTRFKYIPPKTLSKDDSICLIYDVNCSHCSKIKPELKRLCDTYRVPLNVVLVSLLSSPDKAVSWFNSEATFDDFINTSFEPLENLDKKGLASVQSATNIANNIGITSIPAFIISQTGDVIYGSDITQLEAYILNYFERTEARIEGGG